MILHDDSKFNNDHNFVYVAYKISCMVITWYTTFMSFSGHELVVCMAIGEHILICGINGYLYSICTLW